MKIWITCLLLAASWIKAASAANTLPLKPRQATASSTFEKNTPDKAIDGVISDASRWVSQKATGPAWIELDLGASHKLAGIHLYSGYQGANPLESFAVQFWSKGKWQDIPSAKFTKNQTAALAVLFDDTVEVTTDRLRVWITATHQGMARVSEIVVWPASAGNVPPLPKGAATAKKALADEPVPLIYLNQSGFNLGKSKRFTAPTLPDGTPFDVRLAKSGEVLFSGTLKNHIGDFTTFEPLDEREYVVSSGPHKSEPFRIGQWWLERVTYQNAVNFMIDSRHHVGNSRAVCQGSFGWRDDHHFGWELHTLVAQYLSNPSAYARMPHQITYEKPTKPKLWGKLEPYRADAPDMVKLIHWGADVIVSHEVTHEMLKAQLPYFLYAWPVLKDYLPAQNYEIVRDFTFAHWTDTHCDRKYPYDESDNHNLLSLKTRVGTTKGAYPPGFSIQPNLLLYEVAKRDGRPDAEKYFQAAAKQAEWIITNLDWNDPLTTKGQRMSEFVTLTGLAHLLSEYPDRAPAGLTAKINAWADVIVRRSNNLWDFRKLDDGDRWTPMGEKPTMWNEPGNVVGLPAALLAAQPFLTNAATKTRIEQLVWSHFDNMFGRNPVGRHFSYDAPREIEGVEHGWFSFLAGGIGQLAEARFVIDGSPKDAHYPYHPEKGNIGWTEGWVQFNTPFNVSLAYLAHAETKITLRREGDDLVVRLEAPLNFDYAKVETGTVVVTSNTGDHEVITVTEESVNSRFFIGRTKVQPSQPVKKNDGNLQISSNTSAEAVYGFGYLGCRKSIKL